MRASWVVTTTIIFCSETLLFGQGNPTVKPPVASVAPLESSARVQLDRAESLLKFGPADEFLEAYRRVMDKYGDRLIEWPGGASELPAGFVRFGSVRELGWMRLVSVRRTAPEVFAGFRKQLDPQAKAWFDQARTESKPELNQRIVDELFLSSYGDDALLRLGEAALGKGDCNLARYHWERISPGLRFVANHHDPLRRAANRPLWLPFAGAKVPQVWPVVAPLFTSPAEPTELVYPDTDLSIADVRAKLAVVSIMEGNWERARIEIEILNQLVPDATGTIAGRNGQLPELLQALMKQAQQWPAVTESIGWTTYAGSATRSRTLPELAMSSVPVSSAPLWSVPLPRWPVEHEALGSYQVRVAEDARRLLPFHPLVINDLAVVQTGASREQVQAYRIRTGEPALPIVESAATARGLYDRQAVFGVPRFTPTADETTLFLIDGFTMVSRPEDRQRFPAKLQAIDLVAERKLLWEYLPGPPLWAESFSLAGPPVVAGPRLFIVLKSREAGREENHVAALDTRDGRLLWRQFIGAAQPVVDGATMQLSQQLLTVDRETVYCNTNDGLVAALDARTGRVRWTIAYPRVALEYSDPNRNALHFFRDLTPCLLHQDVVVVAPTDCNRLFALDATTGIPLWVTPAELAADAVHLLGVADNRLAVSGECIYWFDIHTGRLLGRYPEPFKAARGFARPSPRGYGRGVVAGQHVYWPTRNAILVFGGGTEQPPGEWRPVVVREIGLAEHGTTGGNLVWGNDTLLIAGSDRLVAFAAKAR